MFPYFPQPYLQIGPFRWYAFPMLVGAAIVTGYWIVHNRSRRLRMPHPLELTACLWVMAWGILAAHLDKVLLPDPAFSLAHPQRLLAPWRGVASFGGLLGGLVGSILWCRIRRIPWGEAWQWLDIVAYAFPFAWTFGRLGCALAHDHPGRRTTSWLAVRYPDGPRYDLGLVEFLSTVAVAGLFLMLDRRRRADGFYFALLGTVYGSFRFWLDTLHVNPPRMWGFTLDQIGAAGTIFVALMGWVVVQRSVRRDG
jgi:phosphatidylglycerol:prolipoprotein diacylglycerol transferase